MMHAVVRGTGRPLVFLHAFPLSSRMWEGEINRFSQTHRVIAPDLPGFGGSSARPEGFTMEAAAGEVLALLDHLQVREPVVLAGLSMGGYILFECLRLFPERIGGVILAATKASPDSEEGKAGRMKTIEQIQREGMEPFTRFFVQKALGTTTLDTRPAVTGFVRQMIGQARPSVVMDALRGLAGRADSVDMLSVVNVPALIIAGEEDKLIPVADHEVMARGIRGAKLEIIPQAGHLVNLEAPDRFQKAVSGFLEAKS